jgi:CRP/FNR family cyclic AMP-dependent transcriptional regulator
MLLWVETVGYIASILVASTFYMKTMLPLRIFAIASNVAFMTYGYFGHLYPVFILHLVLFPLNIIRLRQIKKLVKDVREAEKSEFSLEWLAPYMSRTSYKKHTKIFTKGGPADKMLYIHSGKIRITDIEGSAQSKFLERGSVLGEIGIFAPGHNRTATAIAEENTDVYSINEDEIIQLYYQNPKLAFYLVKLITRRLIEDLEISKRKGN